MNAVLGDVHRDNANRRRRRHLAHGYDHTPSSEQEADGKCHPNGVTNRSSGHRDVGPLMTCRYLRLDPAYLTALPFHGGLAGQHWPTTPHVRPLVAAVARARGSRHRGEEPADSEAV